MNEQQLQAIFPRNPNIPKWYKAMQELLPKYGIDTPLRLSAFLSQCGHESMGLMAIEENLNYSQSALLNVFGKYFTAELAANYARKPELIANRVYANRMGNGPEKSGDGWRYRGRGVIQLTGKNNYQKFAEFLGQDLDYVMGYLTTYKGALESACWYWHTNGLNRFADEQDMRELTRRINGGYNGLEDRINHYEHINHVFGLVTEQHTLTQSQVNMRTLRKGDHGEEVEQLQRALGLSPVDGIFGQGTERAVMAFQARNGLSPDGIAGRRTLTRLFGK